MAPLTNATTPQTDFRGWVSEPNGRGTIGILLPCLAVLFLNTWTILHINIPSPYDGWWRRWLHRVKCWMICVIVPDAIATVAFKQWRRARRSVREMKAFYPWWTLKHGFYAEMGGWRIQDHSSGQMYIFKADQLLWLVKEKVVTIPELPEAELDDRSDADWIAKVIACFQATWFLVAFLGRVDQHLPFTTLELEVVPFIGATWFTYFCWWQKPVNLQTFTLIHVESLSHDTLCGLAKATCAPNESPPWWRPAPKEIHKRGWDYYWFERPLDMSRLSSIVTLTAISTNHLIAPPLRGVVDKTVAESKVADWYRPSVDEMRPSEWTWFDDLFIFIAGLYINGLFLAAWKFHFPTHVESLLWRITVLTMIGVIFIWIPIAWFLRWLLPNDSMRKHIPYYILTVAYAFARGYVIFEPFIGMRRLPAGVFQTVNWSLYIPHIGNGS